MSTINPSICSDPSASAQEEKQPEALRVNFDRIDPKLEKFVGAGSTINHLNRHCLVFQGLNAISRLLLGNIVADDSCEPTLNGYIVGGLLSAAIALSDMAIDDIERLADRADKRASEAGHE
ncbi:hypothetical protein [Burkholderia gladioli]|uniref:hypothetical protein n=1 Tax=Burkholderia gladioli TaxID=28095 RepID=UPI00164077F1|nr:hypothetical protein [Burkholderia gladioli]